MLATYTVVPTPASESSGSNVNVWWTAVGFVYGRGTLVGKVELVDADLAPMVDLDVIDDDSDDATAAPAAPAVEDFAAVPRTAFKGSGRSFPNGTSGSRLVSWESNVVAQAAAVAQGDEAGLCSSLKLTEWSGAYNLSLPAQHYDGAAQLNLAPIFETTTTDPPRSRGASGLASGAAGIALLGEVGKVTAMSTFRFAAVGLTSNRASLDLQLRGSPGELVTLLFARTADSTAEGRTGTSAGSQDFECVFLNATIAANGTALVPFPLAAYM